MYALSLPSSTHQLLGWYVHRGSPDEQDFRHGEVTVGPKLAIVGENETNMNEAQVCIATPLISIQR